MATPLLLLTSETVSAGDSFKPQAIAIPADAHCLLLLCSAPTTNLVTVTITGQTTGQIYYNGLVTATQPVTVPLVAGVDAGVTLSSSNISPSDSAFYSVLASPDPIKIEIAANDALVHQFVFTAGGPLSYTTLPGQLSAASQALDFLTDNSNNSWTVTVTGLATGTQYVNALFFDGYWKIPVFAAIDTQVRIDIIANAAGSIWVSQSPTGCAEVIAPTQVAGSAAVVGALPVLANLSDGAGGSVNAGRGYAYPTSAQDVAAADRPLDRLFTSTVATGGATLTASFPAPGAGLYNVVTTIVLSSYDTSGVGPPCSVYMNTTRLLVLSSPATDANMPVVISNLRWSPSANTAITFTSDATGATQTITLAAFGFQIASPNS